MNSNGLEHFVESMSADVRYCQKVDSVALKESLAKVPQKMRESIDNETPEGWWVPISFYNKKNGNGRIYSKELWNNVMNNQQVQYRNCPMLCDHPAGDSDGSPDKICGVWVDMKMEPCGSDGIGLVYGLLIPSGRLGADLKDHLKNGLRVGTSSSGFGKLMNDGVTVDPDTFQIERLADWVLTPSQGTYFSYDETNNNIMDRSVRESLEREDKPMTEAEHKEIKHMTTSKLEEKKFRRDIESFLRDAEDIKNPQEKLEEFQEIRTYFEEGLCPDLRDKVEEKIKAQEAIIKKLLNESVELHDELGIESTQDLKEKLTRVSEDMAIQTQETKEWKQIAEKLQKGFADTKNQLNESQKMACAQNREYLAEKTRNASLTEDCLELDIRLSEALVREEQLKKENEQLKADAACANCADGECVDGECADGECDKVEESYSKEYVEGLKQQINALTEKLEKHKEHSVKVVKYITEAYKNEKAKNGELQEAQKFTESKESDSVSLVEELQDRISMLCEEYETIQQAHTDELIKAKSAVEVDKNPAPKFKGRNAANTKDDHKEDLPKAKKDGMKVSRAKKADNKDLSPVKEYANGLLSQYGDEFRPFYEKVAARANVTDAKQYFLTKVLNEMTTSKEINAGVNYSKPMNESIQKRGIVIPEGWK